jgi:hypothetical protein
MTLSCIRCHRPLKLPTETGMGRVCAKASRAQPVPAYERDLFGYDLAKAQEAAVYRVRVRIETMTVAAQMAVRRQAAAARRRLGVWA